MRLWGEVGISKEACKESIRITGSTSPVEIEADAYRKSYEVLGMFLLNVGKMFEDKP